TLHSTPNTTFFIDFYGNPGGADPSGYGEGQVYLGWTSVITDSTGFAAIKATGLGPTTLDEIVTATATDSTGNTSEFAADIAAKASLTVITNSSLMLVGNNPPPLTGSVNGTPFTGSINYLTSYGDLITVTLTTAATSASPVGQYL